MGITIVHIEHVGESIRLSGDSACGSYRQHRPNQNGMVESLHSDDFSIGRCSVSWTPLAAVAFSERTG